MSKMMRITDKTAEDLDLLAKELKKSKAYLLEKAVAKLNREIFLKQAALESKRFRKNSQAWKEEIDERKLLDNSLMDGLDEY
ncbi:TPA: hypothetical protein DIC20_00360 [Candidatus Dependentiae bacterium]|nr:hypothetical protein [Candidatus Dependentiae bacterium]HCU00139.1 hypothetical protein [Candidatus Dependentiae bacterium]